MTFLVSFIRAFSKGCRIGRILAFLVKVVVEVAVVTLCVIDRRLGSSGDSCSGSLWSPRLELGLGDVTFIVGEVSVVVC